MLIVKLLQFLWLYIWGILWSVLGPQSCTLWVSLHPGPANIYQIINRLIITQIENALMEITCFDLKLNYV